MKLSLTKSAQRKTGKMHPAVSPQMIENYQRDGVVLIKGLFKDQVDLLRQGVDKNMERPGPYAAASASSKLERVMWPQL